MTQPNNEQDIFARVVMGMPTPKRIAEGMVSTSPAASVSRRWGTVDRLNGNGTLDINVGGIVVPGVRRVATYAATVGETVMLDVVRGDLVVTGTLRPSPKNDYNARLDAVEAITTLMDDAGEAAYTSDAVTQTVPDRQDTTMLLPRTMRGTSLVTRSDFQGGHLFTLNRTGVWSYSATARFRGAPGGGERYAAIVFPDGPRAADGHEVPPNQSVTTLTVAGTERLIASEWVYLRMFQSSGAAINTEVSSHWSVSLKLAWLRP